MSEQPRWVDDRGISDLSIAIDEIYFLRAILADEALILEAHLGYKTFPKARRPFAEEQVRRMTRIASGHLRESARDDFNASRALRLVGCDDGLTNAMWAEQRGLIDAAPTEGDQT